MKHALGTIACAAMLVMTLPARADVKAGVDAWQQGDYARAIAQWRPLADAGDADAQFNLGQAYKLGRGVRADLDTALDWYRRAAQQGHARAEDNLGLLLFQKGDRAGAMPYLQRAAARGEPRAQYIVGTALFNGDLIGKDWVRAYALMTRASASGLQQATNSLREMDKYIPEDQRRQGRTLAASLGSPEKSATPATGAPRPAPPSPPTPRVTAAKPQPAPVRPAPVRPAPAPKPSAPASGNWRVQLGAFSDEGGARTHWRRLSARVGALSAYRSFFVKAGNITRLQAGPLASGADAARLCGAVKAAGSDCFPWKM